MVVFNALVPVFGLIFLGWLMGVRRIIPAEGSPTLGVITFKLFMPVLLFSGGKDSVVMLHLAVKAFWPCKLPFAVMHVDTGHNFPEVLEFRDRVVVVKYGGNAMVDPRLGRAVADDVVLLRAVGLKPVVVHGGGPQISELMARLGKQAEFRDGLRVTDKATAEVAEIVGVSAVTVKRDWALARAWLRSRLEGVAATGGGLDG